MDFPKAIGPISFEGWMPAVVVNNVDPKGKGRIAVWIPRLMPNVSLYAKVKDTKVTLNTSVIKNVEPKNYAKTFSKQITTCNYFWMHPMRWARESVHNHDDIHHSSTSGSVHTHPHSGTGKYMHHTTEPKVFPTQEGRLPKEHENIFVMFIDGDPKKGYWLPYTPN